MKNELNYYMNLHQLEASRKFVLASVVVDREYLAKLDAAIAYAAWHKMADDFRNKHTG